MDSTDIKNSLVLSASDLPDSVKEILSRMEPGDKLCGPGEPCAFQVTLVENGEKVVHFALNDGDFLTIKDPSNPDAAPIKFEMGEADEPAAAEAAETSDEEKGEPSAAVDAIKAAGQPEDETPKAV